MTIPATISPRHDLRLTADELADRDVRHRNMRSRYRELGFDSVAECQAFSDSLADHAAGLPVAPAFVAALAAAEKQRTEQVARDAADAAGWRAEQALKAATERRDNAHRRLAVARDTLTRLPALKAEIAVLDFGRPAEFSELLGFGAKLSAIAEAEKEYRLVGIPQLTAELAQAQAALDAMSKPAPTTASPTKASRN